MKKIVFLFTLMITLIIGNVILAISDYEKTNFVTGIVTASALNVRCGPGMNYKSIGLAYKNEYVRVFAKIGDWYVIQTDNNLIGAASTKYIKGINQTETIEKASENNNSNNIKNDISTVPSELEKELLALINKQRTAYGLSNLSFDTSLQKTARAKAEDLVANNYFAHNSQIYGTPFEMMKSFGVTYKTAGENIAGNSSLEGAVSAWMNSKGHRDNILSSDYNLTGIGIVKSEKYGYILVQMFIER